LLGPKGVWEKEVKKSNGSACQTPTSELHQKQKTSGGGSCQLSSVGPHWASEKKFRASNKIGHSKPLLSRKKHQPVRPKMNTPFPLELPSTTPTHHRKRMGSEQTPKREPHTRATAPKPPEHPSSTLTPNTRDPTRGTPRTQVPRQPSL